MIPLVSSKRIGTRERRDYFLINHAKIIIVLQSTLYTHTKDARVMHSDWLIDVMRLFLTNQIVLFQSSIVMPQICKRHRVQDVGLRIHFWQAIISPIVGKLMDMISVEGEPPNYLFPFLIGDLFIVLSFVTIFFIKMDLSLPKVTHTIGSTDQWPIL